MVTITPQLVKQLRDKTGAGMSDCKKALVDSEGKMRQAIEILRKKGAASAAKRADRSAKEGLIAAKTSDDGKKAVIVEVNCETDFVARNAEFEKFVGIVSETLLNSSANTVEELLKEKLDDDTINGLHNEILAKFSENIGVKRFERLSSEGFFTSYIHAGSKLATLIETSATGLSDKAKSLVRDLAMQIAAMDPQFIDRSAVNAELIEKEKEIYKQQALDSGKKEDIANRIAQGKLDKFFQEQCLVEQTFVKDSNKNVAEVIKEISDDFGSEVKVLSFRRYFLGEQ